MRVSGLLLHPDLDPGTARDLSRWDPAEAWRGAAPLPGGRGSSRGVALRGRLYRLKRESRGGLAGRLLPDLYLHRGPFEREWHLSLWLERRGLAPPLAARWFVGCGPGFRVFTLIAPAEGAASLAERREAGGFSPADLRRVGACVGRLHALGVVHGDLNAGNLLFTAEGVQAIDLRHSYRDAPLPERLRIRNLTRLGRSLAKLSPPGRPPGPAEAEALALGYAETFGAGAGEADALAGAFRVGGLRRLFWSGAKRQTEP